MQSNLVLYGHMLTPLDAAQQLHRLKVITRKELRAITKALKAVPPLQEGELHPLDLPPDLHPAMRRVWLATLMPATWTVQ